VSRLAAVNLEAVKEADARDSSEDSQLPRAVNLISCSTQPQPTATKDDLSPQEEKEQD
jgi:hypothetical protein